MTCWMRQREWFLYVTKTGKVLAACGATQVCHVASSNKQQITVLCCISAAGGVVPPMRIFPGERFGYNPL